MNNLIQNEIFHYAKICGERLFHNFWITVLKKVKIWNQGSLCPLLLCVLLRSFPKKLFMERSCSKNWQSSVANSTVGFCFSRRAKTFICTESELRTMLSLQFWSSLFIGISLIDFCDLITAYPPEILSCLFCRTYCVNLRRWCLISFS